MNLQLFLIDVLKKIFSDNKLTFENDNRNYDFTITEKNSDSDIIFKNGNKRLIEIEVKNGNVFESITKINKNLYDYFISEEKSNKNPLFALQQINDYLVRDSVKYGVLTSYTHSWFMKIENKKLYISNTIEKNLFLKAMNYLIELSLDP